MIIFKYLALIKDVFLSNFKRLSSPYKLNFVVTKSCNSKCLNCNIWEIKPKDELGLDEIEKFAKTTPQLKWIDFTGGEPTNRKDLPEIVSIFNKHCKNLLFVHFPTNGIKTDRIVEMVKAIKKIGNFKVVITVSIDGPQEVNDKLRGVPGDFIKSVATYKELKKIKGVDTYIGTTLFNSNYLYLDQMFSELKDHIPSIIKKDIHINLGHHSDHYYGNGESQDINPSMKVYKEIERFSGKGKFGFTPFSLVEGIYRRHLKKYVENGVTPMSCRSQETSIYLSETGVIYPCSMWDHPLLNIRDHNYDLGQILESSEAQESSRLIQEKKCSQCWTPCEAYQSVLGNFLS
ncbi:MAG: radical SAM protein [Bacteriovoracaceae bacterium]|nr:radical SAM protein [Bacteriovoracaceae bacterium]